MRKPLPGINEKGKGSINLVVNFFKNYQNLSPVLLSEGNPGTMATADCTTSTQDEGEC